MNAPDPRAAERTRLARLRTVIAVVLTSAVVARAGQAAGLAVAVSILTLCLAVAVLAPVATGARRRHRPIGPGRALMLVAAVVALAGAGMVEVLAQ
ncbi:hypothetical protein GCM10027289_17260 [Tsukamurella serpentis]